jgi:hypothetical protein
MSEERTVKGAWVVIALIALGVIAGVAEVVVRHSKDAGGPATVPGPATNPDGSKPAP